MNNRELSEIIHSNSLLARYLISICPADGLPLWIDKRPGYIIVNSDRLGEPGKHWLLCFLPDQQALVQYFDSYGLAPNSYNDSWKSYFWNWCQNVDGGSARVSRNSKPVQDLFSNTCGQHCVSVAHMLLRGFTFDYILNNVYSPTDTCANDSFAVDYVNSVCKVHLQSRLDEKIVLCARYMHSNIL